jgi:hypothetical protein
VRAICRTALIALLIATLANLPAEAAVSRALGFVQTAQSSYLNNIPAADGTNVVPGDALTTDSDGSLDLRFGTNQIYIPGASAVTLGNTKKGILARLSNGSVEFISPTGAGMAIDAEDVLVTPKTPQPTRAQVTLLSKDELKIAAVSGPLELALDGKTYTLTPGRTYGVKIVDNGPPAGQFNTGESARRNRGLIIVVFAAVAAAAGIAYLVKELQESPDVP